MRFRYLLPTVAFALTISYSAIAQTSGQKSLQKVWETDTTLRTPESVLYHPKENVLFVANINSDPGGKDGNGFISKVSLDGKVQTLKWAEGLSAPKGMGYYKDRLYVTDVDQIVAINLADGKIAKTWSVSYAEPFLNDITVDNKGVVYVSDSKQDKIFKIENDKLDVFMEGEQLQKPNGLLAQKGKLMIGSTAVNTLRSIDLATKKITDVASGMGATDGIVTDNKGNYMVSDWNGQVFWVTAKGDKTQLLDTKADKINSADIEYIPSKNLLLVPTFFKNSVVAYQVK